jgi:hypothetical protein
MPVRAWILELVLVGSCVLGATALWARSRVLEAEAEAKREQIVSSGARFVDSMSAEHLDTHFDQLDERRTLLSRAADLRELGLICLVGGVLGGFGAYVLTSVRVEHEG